MFLIISFKANNSLRKFSLAFEARILAVEKNFRKTSKSSAIEKPQNSLNDDVRNFCTKILKDFEHAFHRETRRRQIVQVVNQNARQRPHNEPKF